MTILSISYHHNQGLQFRKITIVFPLALHCYNLYYKFILSALVIRIFHKHSPQKFKGQLTNTESLLLSGGGQHLTSKESILMKYFPAFPLEINTQ